jgi:hypothetical protein
MILTTWGYSIIDPDATVLEDMLTQAEFDEFTANKYALETERIGREIKAACGAIRNYVGWHLSPSLACEMKTTLYDERITWVRGEMLIQLPARFVSSVESVMIGGFGHESYVIDSNGLLRVYGISRHILPRHTEVAIQYTAGLTEDMMSTVKELIAHRVIHSVAVPAGITSEASGGVSVTYNANWINSARATALPDDNKEVLAPFRLQGVF